MMEGLLYLGRFLLANVDMGDKRLKELEVGERDSALWPLAIRDVAEKGKGRDSVYRDYRLRELEKEREGYFGFAKK